MTSHRAPAPITFPSVELEFAWAIGAVALTLLEAIYRLGQRAFATIDRGLTAPEWLGFALLTLLFGYVEGYCALQRRFVPHLLERAGALGADPRRRAWQVALAPLYALSLLGGGARDALRAYASVGLIASAVLVVRALPEPLRGMVDGAVAVALSWGLGALARELLRLRGRRLC